MHAERFLPRPACHPLPDDVLVGSGRAVERGDGLGVPYHTYLNSAPPRSKLVAVYGRGAPSGWATCWSRPISGGRVIAADSVPYRLELAQRLGAGEVVNVREEKFARETTRPDRRGRSDVCIEAAGQPDSLLACSRPCARQGPCSINGEQGALQLSAQRPGQPP